MKECLKVPFSSSYNAQKFFKRDFEVVVDVEFDPEFFAYWSIFGTVKYDVVQIIHGVTFRAV